MVKPLTLNAQDRQRIEAAIAAAEQRTHGEIMVAFARQSSRYDRHVWLIAGLISFLVSGVTVLLSPMIAGDWVLLLQLCSFLAVGFVMEDSGLGPRLAPSRLQAEAVRQRAQTQFFELGLHATAHRAGVLIYISMAERRVEILADQGIDALAGPQAWEDIALQFRHIARQASPVDAALGAVKACADILARHFPTHAENADSLPNDVVVIDG